MSAIAKLPDELLSDIFCLAAGAEIYAKLDVAQVSAHWRRIALNSPLLWADIHIPSWSNISACVALSLVLERTGPSALLDIELSAPFFKKDALGHAATLAPYSARMRVLDTPEEDFGALLTSALHFPALEILRFRGAGPHRYHGPPIRLAAPNLRRLHLESLPLTRQVEELLYERIEVVSIQYCYGINVIDLLTILARCVHLVHLTYIADVMPTHREDIPWELVPLRHLRTLHLVFPFPDILDLLDSVVDRDTVLQTLIVSTYCGHEVDCLLRLCAAVSRDLGRLVSFKFHDDLSLVLRDDAGLTREMRAMNIPRHAWAPVWPHISQENSAQTSTEEVHIPFQYWNDFAEGFAQSPPGRNLRILGLLVSEYDFNGAVSDLPALRTLVFPGLEHIEFWPLGRFLPAVGVAYALRSISSGEEARPIAVTVRGLSQSADHLRELILEDNTGGTWNLVDASE